MRAVWNSVAVRVTALVVASGLLLTCWAARASDDDSDAAAPEASTRVTLGVGALVAPDFEGSDDYAFQPVPQVRVQDFFGFSLDGPRLTYDLLSERAVSGMWELRAGPSLSLDLGRDEDDNDALEGLGDIDPSVLAGGFARLRYGPVTLGLSGGQDLADGHGGALVAVRLGTMIPLGERLRFTPALTATWASQDFMMSTFGVTAGQAARSIYTPYEPDAGFKDVGLSLGVRYQISESWSVNGLVAYKRLLGEAADSPIVEGPDGSPDQLMGLIGVSYAFSF